MTLSTRFVFHLVANSHLDPVWLWDWREGLNEGLITVRTILRLMEEFPELTYIRGEAAIYEHIERHDPESFAKIKEYVAVGRWDYVGGTYVQPDTNLPGTETMARHFTYGQRYFASRFGQPVKVAWAADSFGHSAGLPAIFSRAGIRYYAFYRPSETLFPLTAPVFRWIGDDGSSILAYRPFGGWYGTERDSVAQRLDQCLEAAAKCSQRHVAVFYGMGNHGGGPTRRQLRELRAWTDQHPEVDVMHSGLHRFFTALDEETGNDPQLPVIKGELNFFARGCYSSAAKFKFKYRRAEAGLWRAERTVSAVAAGLGSEPAGMQDAWRGLLFNSFHDILPGSSIERATDEQISWVEGVIHTSQQLEFDSLNQLARQIDLPVRQTDGDHPQPVSLLVWNSHLHPYRGALELEVSIDYRPLWAYQHRVDEVPLEVCDAAGNTLPFQVIDTEHHFMPKLPWRKRVVVDAEIPALGWTVYTLGWVEGADIPVLSGALSDAPQENEITNGQYTVRANKGEEGICIEQDGSPLLSGAGLSLQTLSDPWGAWGNHYEEPEAEDISDLLEAWTVTDVRTLERGPLRARLWVRLEDSRSQAELTIDLYHDRPSVDVQARIFWDRPAARLKFVMPGVGTAAEYEVPGGTIRRGALKEVPGGRWVKVSGGQHPFGFASNALYNYDFKGDTLRATVVRSSRYAADLPETAETPRHLPVIDRGEYRFGFLLTHDVETLPRLACELEAPPIVLPVPQRAGTLPRHGSFAHVENNNLQVLALKQSEDQTGWILRLQELGREDTKPIVKWLGDSLSLDEIPRSAIATYHVSKKTDGWLVRQVRLGEESRTEA